MSSTPIEHPSSQSSPMALTIGSAEHEAYYYDKLTKSMYDCMDERVNRCSSTPICRIWVQLGKEGQKAMVDRINGIFKYGQCNFDIENDEKVNQITSTMLGCMLADISLALDRKAEEKAKAKARAKKGRRKPQNNLLLKAALAKSHVEKSQSAPMSSSPL